MQNVEEYPRIPEFYSGRSVFITGFTGFMGKILVEKILWSCPDVARVFVLMRDKRGLDLHQRLDKIINSDVFGRLRNRDAEEIKKKLIPVVGDVREPALGISEEDRRILCEEVSIIFHCAASVRFDDLLTVSLDINVKGTKSMMDLALDMPHLEAFIYTSTAYSNCYLFDIEEKLYPPLADWRQTLITRDKIDESIISTLTKKYTNHLPNTYVFAKNLCEHVINDYADVLPMVIYRPSIVLSALIEPIPGWSDNLNGPGAVLMGHATGVVRTTLSDNKLMPDVLPVDVAIRGLIFGAYLKTVKKEKGLQVINACSRDRNVPVEDVYALGDRLKQELPLNVMLWNPTNHTTSSKTLFYIYFMLFQALPAVFVDLAFRAVGREPMLMKIQKKFYIAMNALCYFSLNYFHFHNKLGYHYINEMRKDDLEEFNYIIDDADVDQYQYFYDSAKFGQKKYFKMYTEEQQNQAKRLLFILEILDRVVKTSFWAGIAYYIYKQQLIQTFLSSTYHYLLDF